MNRTHFHFHLQRQLQLCCENSFSSTYLGKNSTAQPISKVCHNDWCKQLIQDRAQWRTLILNAL